MVKIENVLFMFVCSTENYKALLCGKCAQCYQINDKRFVRKAPRVPKSNQHWCAVVSFQLQIH